MNADQSNIYPVNNIDSGRQYSEWALVTGASGLLGNELINQLLANGKKVRALYHNTPLKITDHPNLQPVKGDILDVIALEEAMADVTEMYHCAGLVNFSPGKRSLLYKINVEGTANVVNAALLSGVKKMVHVSSVAALGRIRENEMIREEMQWTAATSNSIYGHSKYLGELEVWRGIAEGLNAVIINPSIILGAGDWNEGSTEIFKSVYDGFNWYADGTTGFVDVRDAAKAMLRLMESGITAERFIISAENAAYKDVFFQIADAFGKKRPAKLVTPFLAGIIWRLEKIKSSFSGIEPLLTKETARTAMAKVNYDNNKLKQFLPGFAYLPLQETIKHTCSLLQQKINIG